MQEHNGTLSIAQAASHLGISTDTVRRRLKDGSIEGELKGGRWVITLPADTTEHLSPDGDLVAALQRHIGDLEHALSEKDRQISELHAILTRATTPALPEPARTWWKRIRGR